MTSDGSARTAGPLGTVVGFDAAGRARYRQVAEGLDGAVARLLDDDEQRDEIARQNAAVAAALPLTDVVDWHVIHLAALAAR